MDALEQHSKLAHLDVGRREHPFEPSSLQPVPRCSCPSFFSPFLAASFPPPPVSLPLDLETIPPFDYNAMKPHEAAVFAMGDRLERLVSLALVPPAHTSPFAVPQTPPLSLFCFLPMVNTGKAGGFTYVGHYPVKPFFFFANLFLPSF